MLLRGLLGEHARSELEHFDDAAIAIEYVESDAVVLDDDRRRYIEHS